MLCDSQSGEMRRLTPRNAMPPSGDAVVFSPDGRQIAFMQDVDGYRQIFTVAVS